MPSIEALGQFPVQDAASWMKDKTREAAAEQIAACPPGAARRLEGSLQLRLTVDYDGDLGHRTIALGYWLAEDSWGRGYATE
ncbi:hypothetical protein DFJ73DRAFT_781861, partial [Zopfochytrium polystomum]